MWWHSVNCGELRIWVPNSATNPPSSKCLYFAGLMFMWVQKCGFKRPRTTSQQPSSCLSLRNPISRTFKLVYCAFVYLTVLIYSTRSPLPPPPLAGPLWPVKSAVWAGSFQSFCLPKRALVTQVGGWKEQVAEVGGSTLILDHTEAFKTKSDSSKITSWQTAAFVQGALDIKVFTALSRYHY